MLTSSVLKRLALAVVPILASLSAGAAGRPTGWQTWTWEGNCFAVVYADDSTVPDNSTERAYIAVKHVPKEKTFDGITVVSGLDVPVGADGMLDVGGREFPLLLFGNAGFVRSGEPEKDLIEALSKASEAKVTWLLKDRMEVQTYRLEGFPNAKKTIDTACQRPQATEEKTSSASPPGDKKPPVKPAKRGRG